MGTAPSIVRRILLPPAILKTATVFRNPSQERVCKPLILHGRERCRELFRNQLSLSTGRRTSEQTVAVTLKTAAALLFVVDRNRTSPAFVNHCVDLQKGSSEEC